MKKSDLPQPLKLFKFMTEDAAMSVMTTGISAGTICTTQPPKSKWPGKHVGVLIHLDNSGTWARKVGHGKNAPAWILQGHVDPDHLGFYTQESRLSAVK